MIALITALDIYKYHLLLTIQDVKAIGESMKVGQAVIMSGPFPNQLSL